MSGNKQTLNAGHREPAEASSSQKDYLTKSESCKTARLFGAYKVTPDYKNILMFIENLKLKLGLDNQYDIQCGYEAGCLGYSLYNQLTAAEKGCGHCKVWVNCVSPMCTRKTVIHAFRSQSPSANH